MEDVVEQVSFSGIAAEDLEEFHRQRDKIIAAVIDRIHQGEKTAVLAGDSERMRIARECVSIFFENFYATAKYRLPAAILEYLDWLRGYLRGRDFPPVFIPSMICSTKLASHAFLEHRNSDGIAAVLDELQRREAGLIAGEKK